MILGYANSLKHYRGFGYESCDGKYWLIGERHVTFGSLADLKRYIDENLWNCPRNAGG